MSQYICERCCKSFKTTQHLNQHKNRKKKCQNYMEYLNNNSIISIPNYILSNNNSSLLNQYISSNTSKQDLDVKHGSDVTTVSDLTSLYDVTTVSDVSSVNDANTVFDVTSVNDTSSYISDLSYSSPIKDNLISNVDNKDPPQHSSNDRLPSPPNNSKMMYSPIICKQTLNNDIFSKINPSIPDSIFKNDTSEVSDIKYSSKNMLDLLNSYKRVLDENKQHQCTFLNLKILINKLTQENQELLKEKNDLEKKFKPLEKKLCAVQNFINDYHKHN
jgi:hypothetical protein